MIIAQYYYCNNGHYRSVIGSDSYLPLDKRRCTVNNIKYVKNHPHTKFMKEHQKATHFKIKQFNSFLEKGISKTLYIEI